MKSNFDHLISSPRSSTVTARCPQCICNNNNSLPIGLTWNSSSALPIAREKKQLEFSFKIQFYPKHLCAKFYKLEVIFRSLVGKFINIQNRISTWFHSDRVRARWLITKFLHSAFFLSLFIEIWALLSWSKLIVFLSTSLWLLLTVSSNSCCCEGFTGSRQNSIASSTQSSLSLSSVFRVKSWQSWNGNEHTEPERLGRSVGGDGGKMTRRQARKLN